MSISRVGRFVSVGIAAATALALLSGCSGSGGNAISSSGAGQPVVNGVPAPLTGELLSADSLKHPSLAAKIDNHEEARPQWGLESTDVVFEELVEGGLTRYVAVWHSHVPSTIGPVRSIRPMDPDIITPFLGIVAYSGGQQKFVSMMKSTPVYNAVHGAADTEKYMYRTDKRDAPHNVLVKAPELIAAHGTLAAPQKMFDFAAKPDQASAAVAGAPTSAINVTFSGERYPAWKWDAASGKYLRFQEGKPDYDQSKKQLSATNVVTLTVSISRQYGYVPKTILVTSGKGTVSAGGKTLAINWSKASREAPIKFTDAAGKPVTLASGNTWIEMPPTYGSVKLVAAATTPTPTPSK
jgi:hypothetical protein